MVSIGQHYLGGKLWFSKPVCINCRVGSRDGNQLLIRFHTESRKFDLFPWPPVFFSGDLNRDIARAKSYPHALEESRQATLEFWSDVKKLLYEASGIEKHD